jgi:ribonuclease D
MYKNKISKEEVNNLGLFRYEGEVVVVDSPEALKEAVQELSLHPIIGFDTESRPAFRKGDYYPISLVQMAIEDKVYLIRNQLTGFSDGLKQIFTNPNIVKAGISILDDIRELRKLGHFDPKGVVELNDVARSLGIENSGVRNLSGIFLGCRISKSQQTSNWEKEELSEGQISYAATDAWVCFEIYEKLNRQGFLTIDDNFYFRLPKPTNLTRTRFRKSPKN